MHECLELPKGDKRTACPVDGLLPLLADKWTIQVLASLSDVPSRILRFTELKNGIEGISQKMLTVTLRGLERDGFITRRVFPVVPPRVEYELTVTGGEIIPSMREFMDWMQRSWPDVRRSRADFDRRASESTTRRSNLPF